MAAGCRQIPQRHRKDNQPLFSRDPWQIQESVGSFCAEDSAGGTEGRLFCGSGFAVSGVESDSLGAGWGSTSDSPFAWDSGSSGG